MSISSEHNIWLKSHFLFSVIQARSQRDTEQISRDGPLEIGLPVLVKDITPLQAIPTSTTGKKGSFPLWLFFFFFLPIVHSLVGVARVENVLAN